MTLFFIRNLIGLSSWIYRRIDVSLEQYQTSTLNKIKIWNAHEAAWPALLSLKVAISWKYMKKN